jgi:hypothetical protein
MSDSMNAEIENGSVEVPTTGAVTEDADSGPAAAEAPPIPTKQQMDEQARAMGQLINAGNTLGMLTQNMMNMLNMITGNNPRLAHAVAAELHLIFGEALRLGIKVDEKPTPVAPDAEKSAA